MPSCDRSGDDCVRNDGSPNEKCRETGIHLKSVHRGAGHSMVAALFICKAVTGLRVSEPEEREGLDIATHGERAYNA